MREFVQQHPEMNITEEAIVKSTLTKAERHLKDKFDGRPDKPPSYVYLIISFVFFLRDMISFLGGEIRPGNVHVCFLSVCLVSIIHLYYLNHL